MLFGFNRKYFVYIYKYLSIHLNDLFFIFDLDENDFG